MIRGRLSRGCNHFFWNDQSDSENDFALDSRGSSSSGVSLTGANSRSTRIPCRPLAPIDSRNPGSKSWRRQSVSPFERHPPGYTESTLSSKKKKKHEKDDFSFQTLRANFKRLLDKRRANLHYLPR